MKSEVGYISIMEIKPENSNKINDENHILRLRQEINHIHEQIFILLSQRVVLTEKIWQFKVDKNLPFHDSARENELLVIPEHLKAVDSMTTSRIPKEEIVHFYKLVTELILRQNKQILSRFIGNSESKNGELSND